MTWAPLSHEFVFLCHKCTSLPWHGPSLSDKPYWLLMRKWNCNNFDASTPFSFGSSFTSIVLPCYTKVLSCTTNAPHIITLVHVGLFGLIWCKSVLKLYLPSLYINSCAVFSITVPCILWGLEGLKISVKNICGDFQRLQGWCISFCSCQKIGVPNQILW